MKETPRHEPDLFTGMKRPALPGDLKHRVLSRARQAARSRPSWIDRLWESHALRLAWAASVILLCAVQLYLAGPPPATAHPTTARPDAEPGFAPFLARHPTEESSDATRVAGFPMLFWTLVDLDEVS